MIPLAKVTKLDVSIDLAQPVQEVIDVISIVTNAHPGRQYELLQQIDIHISEALASIQEAQQKAVYDKVKADLSEPDK
ncbi:hypothetical protein A3844_01600 [Paenibacillus helianthi]|uniref:Uncharacterized protein n=1 Tax=Paenibacillus helianthi TaxID=1349432 RepID=A0ABX3EX90_9BACL|nr:hypothetical protein [Paenibacillus helianthi]OKP91834.1 hypothetical protein A3844_01600 [Paenibacillus helianthi]